VNRGLTPDQLGGLLDERRLATLATIRKDGTVLLSPLWFIWEDDGFTLGVAAGDGKLKHIEREPRVSIVVAEDEFPYRGFELRGLARVVDVPYGPEIRRIATRYVGAAAADYYDDEKGGTVLRVEPGDARGWDFADDLTEMGVFGG
jgi:PPOX class probable F420-dependent enzyme